MFDFIKDFAANVKRQRKNLHMNQEVLAEKANVSVQTISSIENAKHFPSYTKLVSISNALKIHPSRLMMGNGEFWEIEDKELQYLLIQTFKDLTPKQREVALKLVKSVAEINI